MKNIDPWDNRILEEKDYFRIIEKYKLIDFSKIKNKIEKPHSLMEKGIIFVAEGDDENGIVEIISNPKNTCVIAGFDDQYRIFI